MEVNKDIGDGIKHRLKDLHKAPDVMVWTKIEADLKKKKKRRFLFFLLPTIGLSLILLLIFKIKTDKKEATIKTDAISNTSINKVKNTTTISTKTNFSKSNNNTTSLDSNAIGSITVKQNNQLNNNTSTNKYQTNSNSKFKNNTSKPTNTSGYTILNKTNNTTKLKTTTSGNTTKKQKIIPADSLITSTIKKDLLALKKQADSISKKQVLKQKKAVKTDSINQKIIKKWSVMPYASLDYFGSLNHATKDNTSTNYGIKLSYLATEDISLRIGVAKLDLNFTSNEDTYNFTEEISYYEIPLEIKQRILKGKANTSIIAGVSYLMLDKASIYTDGIENNLQIESIENTNMSLNLGLGFDTLLLKKLHFVLEPMFKYHFKPLENRLDSKTYTLSILGGLEYKF
ncbi:hypothetical protein [Olleya sp. 1-3]|uniref:hypothetical protein n=1 Tax=Olleya sp. 1-3 TaxID=2058323 RepID=UPI000C345480|nr:hypothetical protein [Olleya sp. 1-3]PKG49921.1 hypothetical protein CXF54_14490 [Olleya sp. 1-3]